MLRGCLVCVLPLLMSLPVFTQLEPLEPYLDWPVVQVPESAPRIETPALREVWRLACGDDADQVVGRIVSAAPGLDGRVLLLDAQLCRVLVVDPEGRVERVLGACGEGPGDFHGVYRGLQLADGRIGAVGGAPAPTIVVGTGGRIVLLDRAGDPAGDWLAGGDLNGQPLCSLRDLRHAGGHVLTVTMRTRASPPAMIFIREASLLDSRSGERTVVVRSLLRTDLREPTYSEADAYEPLAHGRTDVSVDGRLALAPERDRWRLVIRRPDGTGLVIDRPWPSVPRSDADKQAARRALGDTGGIYEILDDHPAMGRVRWRPDGLIWVEPGGPSPELGALTCCDELSGDGRLLRRVRLAVPDGGRPGDRLLFLEDGRFVILRGFARQEGDEPPPDIEPEVILLES